MKPVRIQLSRRAGFSLLEHSLATNGLIAVNCARPGKWGNPWKICEHSSTLGRIMSRADAVRRFRDDLLSAGGNFKALRDGASTRLRGKNLACWCPLGEACHADVLLELANKETLWKAANPALRLSR